MSNNAPHDSFQSHLLTGRRSESVIQPIKSSKEGSSHGAIVPPSRLSLRTPRDQYRAQLPIRSRTLSVSEESTDHGESDTIPSSIPVNKNEKRNSETTKTSSEHPHAERRNSIAQIHFGSLFSGAFRSNKHHPNSTALNKSNIKEETDHPTNVSPPLAPEKSKTKTDLSVASKPTMNPSTTHQLSVPIILNRSVSAQNEISSPSVFMSEEISTKPRLADQFITKSQAPLCVSKVYRENFYDYFHTNYLGDSEACGPFLASFRFVDMKKTTPPTHVAHLIVRTAQRNYDLFEFVDESNEQHIMEQLFHRANIIGIRDYGPVGDPKCNEKLYHFDKINDERHNCKIGMMFQRSDQTEESQILSNDQMSESMTNFLNSIANHVTLKGFEKYRADLDTTDDLHGEHSYHTEYEDHEIMFNVAPMIPTSKTDDQHIRRKGLVGNAFVCVVFQEPNAVFVPDQISGRVTQIFITVQPMNINDKLHYKVVTWKRNDITSVIDPPGGIFLANYAFRSYFLTLLLNAVTVAVESPRLRNSIWNPRYQSRFDELTKLIQVFSLSPMEEFNRHVENLTVHPEIRQNTRRETFSGTQPTVIVDGNNANAERISPSSSKKLTLPKRIFHAFSSRSASISTASGSTNFDGSVLSSTLNAEPSSITSRFRDPAKRSRSPRNPQSITNTSSRSGSSQSNSLLMPPSAGSSTSSIDHQLMNSDRKLSAAEPIKEANLSSTYSSEFDTDETSSSDERDSTKPFSNSKLTHV